MWITAERFMRDGRCLRIGDTVFLPSPSDEAYRQALDELDEETIAATGQELPFMPLSGLGRFCLLEDQYKEFVEASVIRRERRQEPRWIRKLSPIVQGQFRAKWYRSNELLDQRWVNWVPFSGIQYVVLDGGFTRALADKLKLYRLEGIRQLGFLRDPNTVEMSGQKMGVYTQPFHHDRFDHSLSVAALLRLMAYNNRLPRYTWRNGYAAGMTHDALTPAGGDTTKFIDPVRFDEDAHYPELLVGPAWQELRRRYGLSAKLLIRTIRNEGVLGQLLDLADKIAYVGRDAWKFAHHAGAPMADAIGLIGDFVQDHPDVCTLWQWVTVVDGRVAVRNAEALYDFLTLRALLFRHLYYNPQCRFHELLLATNVTRYLYEMGALTAEWLISHGDYQLEDTLSKFLERPNWQANDFFYHDYLKVEAFADRHQAECRQRELFRSGITFLYLEDVSRSVKTGADFFVETPEGQVGSLAAMYPAAAEQLASSVSWPKPYRLYWATETAFSKRAVKKLRAWKRRKLGL